MGKKTQAPPIPIPGADVEATELVAVSALKPHPRNYRVHPPEQLAHIVELMRIGGVFKNIVVARDNTILMGHGVTEAAKLAGRERLPVRRLDVDSDDPRALMLVAGDNEIGKLAQTDDAALAAILAGVNESIGLLGTGMDDAMLAALIDQGGSDAPRSTLAEKFLVPPFSVLDARQGYWQDRKRAWLALGIKSELGRVAPIGGGADASGSRTQGNGGGSLQPDHGARSSNAAAHGRLRSRAEASPGGSPRPAMNLRGGKTVRGDGAGRAL